MKVSDTSQWIGKQSRRRVLSGGILVLGSIAASRVWAVAQQPAMAIKIKGIPGAAGNQNRTSLHYEAEYKAAPQRVYDSLLDQKQFAALTGLSAEIDAKEGGAFSLFGGLIGGRNVELLQSVRIVQAWRPSHWEPGVYSIVRFELKPGGPGSKLTLDHTGFPAGLADHLDQGWHTHYLDALQKYFS